MCVRQASVMCWLSQAALLCCCLLVVTSCITVLLCVGSGLASVVLPSTHDHNVLVNAASCT